MRFDIYKGEHLAATFVYGLPPRYYGALGDELANLFAATPIVYNLWTREAAPAPTSERADWWAARIISAPLSRAGFALRPVQRPVDREFAKDAGGRGCLSEVDGLQPSAACPAPRTRQP